MLYEIVSKISGYFSQRANPGLVAKEALDRYAQLLQAKRIDSASGFPGYKAHDERQHEFRASTYALLPHLEDPNFRMQVDRLIDDMYTLDPDTGTYAIEELASQCHGWVRRMAGERMNKQEIHAYEDKNTVWNFDDEYPKIVARNPDLVELQAYCDACHEKYTRFVLEWAQDNPHELLDYIAGRHDEAGGEIHGLAKVGAVLAGAKLDEHFRMSNRDIFEARMAGMDMHTPCDTPYFEALMKMDPERTFGTRPKDTIGSYAMLLKEGPYTYRDTASQIYADLRERVIAAGDEDTVHFVNQMDYFLSLGRNQHSSGRYYIETLGRFPSQRAGLLAAPK